MIKCSVPALLCDRMDLYVVVQIVEDFVSYIVVKGGYHQLFSYERTMLQTVIMNQIWGRAGLDNRGYYSVNFVQKTFLTFSTLSKSIYNFKLNVKLQKTLGAKFKGMATAQCKSEERQSCLVLRQCIDLEMCFFSLLPTCVFSCSVS